MQMMPPISYFWKFAYVAPRTSVSGAWTVAAAAFALQGTY